MGDLIDVRIIVVTYNSQSDIAECLTSLAAQVGVSIEIVVVENASKDQTAEIISSRFPFVKMIQNVNNLGFVRGCNQGLVDCRSRYVAFVNPDTLSELEWLRSAVATIELNSRAGVCQPKILLFDDRKIVSSVGNKANFLFFAWSQGYGVSDDQISSPSRVSFASGCAALYKRECLEKTQGLDEAFVMYGDDVDLGIRCFVLGYDITYSPMSIVYHKYRFKESPQKYFLLERNRLMILLKIYRLQTLLLFVPILLVSEIGVVLKSLRDGWFSSKLASYGSVMRNWQHIRRGRSLVQLSRVRSDSDVIEFLEGPMSFSAFSGSILIRVGNKLLERYRSFLLSMRL